MKRLILPIAIALSAVAACSGNSARVSPIAALTPNLTNGKTVYTANCASCHGSDGRGTGGSEKKNVAAVAKNNKTTAIDQTLNGGGGMSAYDGLSDQQIADVVAYLASLN